MKRHVEETWIVTMNDKPFKNACGDYFTGDKQQMIKIAKHCQYSQTWFPKAIYRAARVKIVITEIKD